MKLRAVSSGRPKYPALTPRPPMWSSPSGPSGTSRSSASPIAVPMGTVGSSTGSSASEEARKHVAPTVVSVGP